MQPLGIFRWIFLSLGLVLQLPNAFGGLFDDLPIPTREAFRPRLATSRAPAGTGKPAHLAARDALAEQSMAIHFKGRRSPIGHVSAGSAESLLADCHVLSRLGLRYQYGSNKPRNGGLDCSGTVQHLLQKQGLTGVPRQANTLFLWLQKNRNLRSVHREMTSPQLFGQLRPGDLLFWEGTYDVKRVPNITHVMIYVGFDSVSRKHLMFGASGSKSHGISGHGVDYFEFEGLAKRGRGRFVGFGRAPGLL